MIKVNKIFYLFICAIVFLYTSILHAAVDIVVNENDSPDPIAAGGTLTYTLNVANNGPDDSTGVSLTAALPATVSLQSVVSSQGTCTGTTTITCSLGNIDNNAAVNIVIKVTVPTTPGTLTSTFTGSSGQIDTNLTNNSKIETTTVVQSADLQITKTDSADPVSEGATYNYVLAIKNLGPFAHTTADTVTVTDNIPSSMRLQSLPSGTNWTCSSSGGTTFPQNGPVVVTCQRNIQANNALAVNASFQNITVPVKALAYGTVTNEASVSSTMADKNTANNTVTENTSVNQAVDLSVAKVLTNTSNTTIGTSTQIGAGATYRYRLTPSLVIGDTADATVRVTDPLPNNIQVTTSPTVSGNSGVWSCDYSPSQTLPFTVSASNPVSVICDSSTPYVNTSTTTQSLGIIQFDFIPTQGGTLTNAATVGSVGNILTDIATSNNTASVTHTVNGNADLRITKTVNGSGAVRALNSTATYTLAYRNAGTSPIPAGTTVTITDTLPSGVQITAITAPAGWSCPTASTASPINGPTTITCTLTNGLVVSSSNNGSITLSAKFTSTGVKQNIGNISSVISDPDLSNNQSDNTLTIVDTSGGGTYSDLSIVKDDTVSGNTTYGPDPVAVTGNVRYRLRVTNNGPSNMPTGRTVTVTDTIPVNSTIVSYAPTVSTQGWSCSDTGTVITCTRTVSASSTWTVNTTNDIDVVLKANNGTTMTNYSQVVTTNDPIGSNDTAQQQTTILDDANLKLVKTVSATSVYMGQSYTYTFVVTNQGRTAVPVGASNAIRLVDSMNPDPGATLVSTTATANGWTCTTAGTGNVTPLTCDYAGGLAVGASTSFTVTVTPRTVGTARSNTASISFVSTAVVADPDFTDNSSTVTLDVLPSADLQIGKSASLTTVAAGQNLTYILTARNNGPSVATNVTVIDTLPSNVTVMSITPTGAGTCQQDVPTAGKIQCQWASLANNTTQSVTVVVRPQQAAAGTNIINTATISSDIYDAVSTNNTSSVSTTVTSAVIDLVINKSDLVDPVAQNGTVVYTVTVNNLGPSVATNVIVTENLPYTYLEFIDATPQQGSCTTPNSSHQMLCNLGSVEAGQTITITIRMLAKYIGTDVNQVSVQASETDSLTTNNSDSENTTVQLGTDVQVTKLVDSTNIYVNQSFWYTINIFNEGPANSNVTLTDTIPVGIDYVSYTITGGSCTYNSSNKTLTCNMGLMTPATTKQVRVQAVSRQLGTIINTANVSGSTPELILDNNQSSVSVNSQLIVSGRVFNDNGGTVNNIFANAYNGVQDTGENGIAGARIQLTNCISSIIAETTTNAAGDYQFIRNANLPSPYCIIETNTQNFTSVSGVANYTRSTDTISVANSTVASYTTGNFGDANLSVILIEDGQHTIKAGEVTDYPHRLISYAPVNITQMVQNLAQQPASSTDQVWQAIIYQDTNCNGKVDAGESVFNPTTGSPILLQPATDICLVQRVLSPSNAYAGAQQMTRLQASYQISLSNPSQTITGQSNQRQDTTLIGSAGLDLQKRVRTVATCPSTVSDSTSFAINNQATSQQKLEYEITYKNNSVKVLQNVKLKDSVPLDTTFGSINCQSTPSGITGCTATHNNGQLEWVLTGNLPPSATGTVRFCVSP